MREKLKTCVHHWIWHSSHEMQQNNKQQLLIDKNNYFAVTGLSSNDECEMCFFLGVGEILLPKAARAEMESEEFFLPWSSTMTLLKCNVSVTLKWSDSFSLFFSFLFWRLNQANISHITRRSYISVKSSPPLQLGIIFWSLMLKPEEVFLTSSRHREKKFNVLTWMLVIHFIHLDINPTSSIWSCSLWVTALTLLRHFAYSDLCFWARDYLWHLRFLAARQTNRTTMCFWCE